MKYAWHVVNIFALLIGVWGYGIFGSAFVNAQPKYQWILAFLNPLIREINFHLIYFASRKATNSEEGFSGKSVKLLTQHYAYAKHAVFLAVIVGGVGTPATNYCIVAIDFIEAIFDCLKIIRKYKKNQEIEGIR